MPSPDPEKRKAAHAAWYQRNKAKINADKRASRNGHRYKLAHDAALKAQNTFMRDWLTKAWTNGNE